MDRDEENAFPATMWNLIRFATYMFLLHFTETLTPELAEHFVTLPPDPEFQQRLDEIGSLANEGALSEEERREYDTYIETMDVIALLRVKVLSRSK